MRYCAKCGAEIDDETSTLCDKCFAELIDAKQRNANPPKGKKKEKGKNKTKEKHEPFKGLSNNMEYIRLFFGLMFIIAGIAFMLMFAIMGKEGEAYLGLTIRTSTIFMGLILAILGCLIKGKTKYQVFNYCLVITIMMFLASLAIYFIFY